MIRFPSSSVGESEEISFSDGDNGFTFDIDNNAEKTDIVDVPVILVKCSISSYHGRTDIFHTEV